MIRTRPVTKKYEQGWEQIFGKKILMDNGGSVIGVDMAEEGSKVKTILTLSLYDKNGSKPLKDFSYDPINKVFTIYGIEYGEYFFKLLKEVSIGVEIKMKKLTEKNFTMEF